MDVEDLLLELGIKKEGNYSSNGSYVIDLDSSEEFGKIYSLLDTNKDLEYEEDSSLLTVDNSSMIYNYDDIYQIVLIADFKNNQYKVTIREI